MCESADSDGHLVAQPVAVKIGRLSPLIVRLQTLLVGLALVSFAAPLHAQEPQPWVLPADWVAPQPTGFISEPVLLRQVVNSTDAGLHRDGQRDAGPYAEFGNMISGSGWFSVGPGYRGYVLDGLAQYDVSAAISTNLYKAVQARFESSQLAHKRLLLGVQGFYQDLRDVNYYGRGIDSSEADRSGYRLRDTDVLGYATVRATPWLAVHGRFGWLRHADLSAADGPNVTFPNTADLFLETAAPGITTQPSFLHGDVSAVADFRDHAGHPTSGGMYRASAAMYSDRDAGIYSFRRYEIEASQCIPIVSRNWVLALHAWEVFSDASGGDVVPFYLMPSLGGQNTLRGYADYRFHDNNMQLVNAESRWALFAHLDVAAFVDAGKVAALAGDLDFTHLKTSYGAGLRLHNATSTLVRIDLGRSTEGWRMVFKISDPFKRSTPASGRSSVIPFVP